MLKIPSSIYHTFPTFSQYSSFGFFPTWQSVAIQKDTRTVSIRRLPHPWSWRFPANRDGRQPSLGGTHEVWNIFFSMQIILEFQKKTPSITGSSSSKQPVNILLYQASAAFCRPKTIQSFTHQKRGRTKQIAVQNGDFLRAPSELSWVKYPPVNYHSWLENPPFEDVISYWKRWISIAMLVYWRVFKFQFHLGNKSWKSWIVSVPIFWGR